MQIYVPLTGEEISKTANKMVLMTKQREDLVVAKFNDIQLTARPYVDTANNIVEFYHKEHWDVWAIPKHNLSQP